MSVYYFINGGTDNNWNTTSNWSLSTGGTSNGAVPTSNDDAHFDANSPNCTIDEGGGVPSNCFNFICTGYTHSISLVASMGSYVSGDFILSSAMSILAMTGYGGMDFASGTPNNINTFSKFLNFGIRFGGNTTLLSSVSASSVILDTCSLTGSFGFSTTDLTIEAPVILASGITYSTANIKSYGVYSSGTPPNTYSISSSIPGSQSILTITGSQDITYVDATDIDSSGGNAIYTFKGVLTNTKNWNSVITPRATGYTF